MGHMFLPTCRGDRRGCYNLRQDKRSAAAGANPLDGLFHRRPRRNFEAEVAARWRLTGPDRAECRRGRWRRSAVGPGRYLIMAAENGGNCGESRSAWWLDFDGG